jgi:ABC1 atypical kinase-like domain
MLQPQCGQLTTIAMLLVQRVLLAGLPLGLSWYLSEPAHCFDVGAAARTEPAQRHALLRVVDSISDELAMMCRAVFLLLLFAPAALLAPICVGLGWRRRDWLLLVRWTLERAGPAFIKWGQWAATRPDMFPTDLCDVLASLQTGQFDGHMWIMQFQGVPHALRGMTARCARAAAPRHAFKHTRRTIEAAFRMPLEELFSEFSTTPVASGSIAQVGTRALQQLASSTHALRSGLVKSTRSEARHTVPADPQGHAERQGGGAHQVPAGVGGGGEGAAPGRQRHHGARLRAHAARRAAVQAAAPAVAAQPGGVHTRHPAHREAPL